MVQQTQMPPTEMRAALPVLDTDVFAVNTKFLSPATILSYLEMVLADTQALQRSLRSLKAGRPVDDAVADAAHKLAGKAGMLGFARVTAASLSFERSARTGAAVEPAITTALDATLDASAEELLRRLANVKAA